MRILILGAGTVGTSIADLLCRHGHSITVVDSDPSHTRRINEELDVRVVAGSASKANVLFQADVAGAELCLAVTGIDEVNLVAASLAKAMGARRSVARVFAPAFRDTSTFDYCRLFHIDRLLSLEYLAGMEFARGIRDASSVAVENLARGELEVQDVVIRDETVSLGVPLSTLGLPKTVRIGAICRDDETWIAGAQDKIQLNDRITIIGLRGAVDEVKKSFQKKQAARERIVIIGGGETGFSLAHILEGLRFRVLLVELDSDRCEFLARRLKHATVVQADATRHTVLEEERVGAAEFFVSCLGDDEENIMACVEARELGAKSVMGIVSRPDYANVVGKLGIDLAVSPREVMAKQVLSFLNPGPVITRTVLTGQGISVLEIEVLEGAPVTEHVLANVALPNQCLIAAVARDEVIHVPGADDRLRAGDTVVTLVQDSSEEDMLTHFRVGR